MFARPDARAAVGALIETLKAQGDTYRRWLIPEARQAAATALGRIGPVAEPAVPALIDVLRERSPDAFFLRPAAATALGRIGQPVERVVSALTDALRSKPRDTEIIEPAFRALGRIGPGSAPAIPTLLKTLESPLTFDGAAIRAALWCKSARPPPKPRRTDRKNS